ncbi:MAG: hypothetical protein FWE71_02190 [Nocardioidaceae bacterium]|nr:hypothetical protein [Nocardioidaceae bacterium]MCL2611595.1 hypothetical protein [Nocardioidaceae bacterium]
MNNSNSQRTPLAGEGPRKTNPYATTHNRLAIAWKQRAATLPDEAREPGHYSHGDRLQGPYPVCLPLEYAAHNLLPEVRDGALALFAELDISWHDSVAGGPSNHLRDSQVQCVNALFAMVSDPDRLKRAFGRVVDIAEVFQIEDGRYLTFEYIGPTDYFGEGVRHGKEVGRRRGTNCTSVDAAFLFRSSTGVTELALVEWKFTESYLTAQDRDPASDAVRIGRYAEDLSAPDGPVRADVLPIELLLDEPFYQLMRQQLLAHRLEQAHAHGADVVRVLHVLSPDNTGYQDSLARPEHRAIGATVDEAWSKLLRAADRFVHIDPSVFLDPLITSEAYVDRYATSQSLDS